MGGAMDETKKAERAAKARAYYLKNKERLYAKECERRKTPEGRAQRNRIKKAWAERHKERVKATDKKYYALNKEKILARRKPLQKAWFQRLKADPERYAAYLERQKMNKRRRKDLERRRQHYAELKTRDPVGYRLMLLRARANSASVPPERKAEYHRRHKAKKRAALEAEHNEVLAKVARAGILEDAKALLRQKAH